MTRVFIVRMIALMAVFMTLCSNAGAHPPWGIVADRQGRIYFSDLETIWKIDAKGRLTVFKAGVSGRHTHELAIDEGGNLLGEELTYDSSTQRYRAAIWRMTPAGGLSYDVALTLSPVAGLSLWRDRAGNMYSVKQNQDSQREILVLKRTPDGKLITLHGSERPPPKEIQPILYSVGGITFAPDGTLYATDGKSILKINLEGKVTTLVDNIPVGNIPDKTAAEGTGVRILGLAVDAQGNVFAVEHNSRRVLKISPEGKTTTLLQTEGPWSPTGVTILNGELYILEFGFTPPRTTIGPRVQKLAADGRITTVATVGAGETASTQDGSTDTTGLQSTEPQKLSSWYALIGAGAVMFALIIIAWQLHRKGKVAAVRNSRYTSVEDSRSAEAIAREAD